MSQADVERFVEDLKNNDELRAELSAHASGIGSVVSFAQDKGYDIDTAEASAYINAQSGQELSDTVLDSVAGGKGHNQASNSATNTSTNAEAQVEVVALAVAVLT